MAGERVLVLGGKPIGSCELVRYARDRCDYAIVTDYLPEGQSPAKLLADASWDVSTADVDELTRRSKAARITAVVSGVHEFNIARMIELSDRLDLPCYCTADQWEACEDKRRFKDLCSSFGIDVAKEYDVGALEDIPDSAYPLAVKPADGSGSRGFSKVDDPDKLADAIGNAKRKSPSGEVLIEEFIESDAVIIHYTIHNGKAVYSGMLDKHSRKAGKDGAPVMALQIGPSIWEAEYLKNVNSKTVALLESLNIREAPVWIEAFLKNGRFVFNEAGLRFGGSMTHHFVSKMAGIDQMALFYDSAIGLPSPDVEPEMVDGEKYAIWPVHLRRGTLTSIEGLEQIAASRRSVAITQVHFPGDDIEDWGSAQQVFAYLHFCAKTIDELVTAMVEAKAVLSVLDEYGNEMLCSLFDPSDRSCWPDFLNSHSQCGGRPA